MANYSLNVSLDDYKKAARKKGGVQDLYDRLEEIQAEYDKNGMGGTLPPMELPDKVVLDRVEAVKKSEAELKAQAEAENEAKYRDKLDQLTGDTESKKNQYGDKIAGEEQAAAKRRQEVDALYDERAQRAEQSALSRGLARSSVIMAQIENFDKGRIGDKLSVDEETADEIRKLQRDIDGLDDQLSRAKETYDGEKQADIEKRLMQLLDDQEQKYLAAVRHNNDAAAKEAEYARQREAAVLARAKAEAELERNRREYGGELGKEALLKQKFDAVKGYLEGMDAKDALDVLNSDKTIKESLGSYYRLMKMYFEGK